MRILASLLSGLVFGTGLVVSGMNNPAKVLNFLDITGSFDPSLAFVMLGAVSVAGIGYRLQRARERPVLDAHYHLPDLTSIDRPLLVGAAIFGFGWGLAGFCPGPAVTALATFAPKAWLFFAFMIAGIWMARSAKAGTDILTSEDA